MELPPDVPLPLEPLPLDVDPPPLPEELLPLELPPEELLLEPLRLLFLVASISSTRRHSRGVITPSLSRSYLANSATFDSLQDVEYSDITTWPSPSASLRANQSGRPLGNRSAGDF